MEKMDGIKTLRFSEIETPTTKEEFHINLKKYFLHDGENLLTQKTPSGMYDVKIDELNSMDEEFLKDHGISF